MPDACSVLHCGGPSSEETSHVLAGEANGKMRTV